MIERTAPATTGVAKLGVSQAEGSYRLLQWDSLRETRPSGWQSQPPKRNGLIFISYLNLFFRRLEEAVGPVLVKFRELKAGACAVLSAVTKLSR